MTTFREWLFQENHDYDSDQDRLEHEAFEFVFGKIKQATAEATNSKVSLIDAMKKVWPESEGGRGVKFILPKEKFPTLVNLRVRLNTTTDESSVERNGNEVGTLYIGGASLQAALSNNDQQSAQASMRRIAGSLNHEMTHLHHKGANEGDGGVEDAIRYMVSLGEMRAHAKDYAYTWSSMFPGQAFNPQMFVQNVLPTLVSSKQAKAKNYFVAFADPQKQAKYKHVADLGAANRQLLEMVAGYVGYYMKRTQPQKTRPQQPTTPQPTTQFQGFNTNDTRGWQQRQQYLNSIGVDTTGWGRAEIMRGVKNKA
jgi:hypothetical protein